MKHIHFPQMGYNEEKISSIQIIKKLFTIDINLD